MNDYSEASAPGLHGAPDGYIHGLDDDPQAVEHLSQDPDDQRVPSFGSGSPQGTSDDQLAANRCELSRTIHNGHGEVINFPNADNAHDGVRPDKTTASNDETVQDGETDDEAPLPRNVYRARFVRCHTNFNHSTRREGQRGAEYRGKCVVQYEIIGGEHAGRPQDRHFNVWFSSGKRAGSKDFLPPSDREALFREACAASGCRVRRDRCMSALRNSADVWVLVGSAERDAEGYAIESFASYSRIERVIGGVGAMSEQQAREKAGL